MSMNESKIRLSDSTNNGYYIPSYFRSDTSGSFVAIPLWKAAIKREERLVAENEAEKERRSNDIKEYNEKKKELFLDAVIRFEEKVPEEFRSIRYFLDWVFDHYNADYHADLHLINFQEWLDGIKSGFSEGENKDDYTASKFGEARLTIHL